MESIRGQVMGELRSCFRPEFLNRIEDVVVFHRLSRDHIVAITRLELEQLRLRLAGLGITMAVTDAAVETLAERGYDPVYGARPLRRTIARNLETPVSRLIVAGEVSEGVLLTVDQAGGELVFSHSPAGPAEGGGG